MNSRIPITRLLNHLKITYPQCCSPKVIPLRTRLLSSTIINSQNISVDSSVNNLPNSAMESSNSTTELANKMQKQSESIESSQEPADSIRQRETKLDKLYKTLELEVLAYQPSVLDSYQWFVITAATHLGIKVGKCWSPLKSDKHRFPLLKSAFVHKKHQVHYEIRTYHKFLTFHKLTGSTADTFLEYIERNLPEGCGMKVTRVEAIALPDFLKKK